MSFRRAARVDENQPEIVSAFRRLGWSVLIISQLKKCCDLFVSKGGVTVAIEIKDGEKPLSARKLTKGELDFKTMWQGRYELVESIDDVIKLNNGGSVNPDWPESEDRIDIIGSNGNDGYE